MPSSSSTPSNRKKFYLKSIQFSGSSSPIISPCTKSTIGRASANCLPHRLLILRHNLTIVPTALTTPLQFPHHPRHDRRAIPGAHANRWRVHATAVGRLAVIRSKGISSHFRQNPREPRADRNRYIIGLGRCSRQRAWRHDVSKARAHGRGVVELGHVRPFHQLRVLRPPAVESCNGRPSASAQKQLLGAAELKATRGCPQL